MGPLVALIAFVTLITALPLTVVVSVLTMRARFGRGAAGAGGGDGQRAGLGRGGGAGDGADEDKLEDRAGSQAAGGGDRRGVIRDAVAIRIRVDGDVGQVIGIAGGVRARQAEGIGAIARIRQRVRVSDLGARAGEFRLPIRSQRKAGNLLDDRDHRGGDHRAGGAAGVGVSRAGLVADAGAGGRRDRVSDREEAEQDRRDGGELASRKGDEPAEESAGRMVDLGEPCV